MLVLLKFLEHFSERQILWSLCSVVFHATTLKLPIQTSLSVAPKLTVSSHSAENCHKIRKTNTPPPPPKEITRQYEIKIFGSNCRSPSSGTSAQCTNTSRIYHNHMSSFSSTMKIIYCTRTCLHSDI